MDNEHFLALRKLKAISDYQFGPDITDILFDRGEQIRLERSKNTNKIRYIFYNNELLLSLRPTNGFFTLNLFSAEKIRKETKIPRLRAIVLTEISEFIKKGRNVFCKHIIDVDNSLRAMDEVIVVNQNDELLGVGRLKISVPYIRSFEKGIAINMRRGVYKKPN